MTDRGKGSDRPRHTRKNRCGQRRTTGFPASAARAGL